MLTPRRTISLAALLAVGAAGVNATVQPGMTRSEVVEEVGEPKGVIRMPDRTRLLYERGEVTLRDGAVSAVDLVSPEAWAKREKERARERAEWEACRERLRQRRIETGRRIKRERLNSASFANLPAQERLEFWRSFQRRYPEVDISEPLNRALEAAREAREDRQRKRIRELEARIDRLEQGMAEARDTNEKLREELEERPSQRAYFWGGRRFGHHGGHHRAHAGHGKVRIHFKDGYIPVHGGHEDHDAREKSRRESKKSRHPKSESTHPRSDGIHRREAGNGVHIFTDGQDH